MATVVGLAMKITADTAGVSAGVTQTEKLMRNLGKAAENVDKIFGTKFAGSLQSVSGYFEKLGVSLPGAVAGLAAFGTAATAIVSSLVSIEDRVERLSVEANKLGTSFGFIQTLAVAAERTGNSIDSVRITFTALLRNIEAARNGSKSVEKAFGNLGISAEDLASKTPESIFKDIVQNIGNIEDPAVRAASALAVLGENGARLLPTFAAIADSQSDLERFSAQLSSLDQSRLSDLGDGFDDLSLAFSGLQQELSLPFAGLVEGLSKGFADIIGGVSDLVSVFGDVAAPFVDLFGAIGQAAGSAIGILLRLVSTALEPVAAAFRRASTAIQEATKYVDSFLKLVNDGISSIQQFFGFSGEADVAKPFQDAEESIDELLGASQQFGKEIETAASKASEFGQGGFDAALELQSKLEEINELQREGEYTQEQAKEAAARANEEFENRIKILKDQKKLEEEAAERAEKYASRLEKLQASLVRTDIETNAKASEEEEARQQDFANRREKLIADLAKSEFDESIKRAEQRASLEEQLAEKSAEIEASRLDALSRANQNALEASDIRSGGISQFLALATGREDPAVAEARAQRQELEKIAAEIRKLGGTVELVGAA
jgi:hypothetical protein